MHARERQSEDPRIYRPGLFNRKGGMLAGPFFGMQISRVCCVFPRARSRVRVCICGDSKWVLLVVYRALFIRQALDALFIVRLISINRH